MKPHDALRIRAITAAVIVFIVVVSLTAWVVG